MAVEQLSEEIFEKEVLQSDKKVLIDFYADWCGPCKMMAPVLEQVAAERTDVKVFKVNVDDDAEIAQKYGVMSVPTFICVKEGKLYKKEIGARPKSSILAMLD